MQEFTTFVRCILHVPRSQLRRVHRFLQEMMYRKFLMFITAVIVAYMAYTRVMCASMHVLFPIRKFLLCAIAFASGKLRVVLKIADQSRAGSHFSSQNTHSQFCNSQLAFYPYPNISWCCQNLSSLLLKVSVVVAVITISGKLFHTLTILGAKENFLKS